MTRQTMGLTLILSGLLAVAGTASQGSDDGPKKPFVPTSAYETQTVRGWTVHVNRALLGEDRALGDKALALLDRKLEEIERTVPGRAVDSLKRVGIWLGVDDGHAPCAEYHPNRRWLIENGYNPDKARCVEIGNAGRFVEWVDTQPSMILHELAHAYHDQVLGFSQPEIKAAYERARASGRYDRVRHANGRTERHYALTDSSEFFAELSESVLGRNDFFPFTRVELEEFDPASFELVERLWQHPPDRPRG